MVQVLSITLYFITLLIAACRAIFVYRDIKRFDPEPTLHMMIR